MIIINATFIFVHEIQDNFRKYKNNILDIFENCKYFPIYQMPGLDFLTDHDLERR